MTKEHIEDYRKIVLPFVKKRLLEINYENLGEFDAEEFEKDFNEILDMAIKALEQIRWIPVSERLPNFAGTYLVTRFFPNNVMNPTYLVDACFFDGTDTWHNDNRINHERKYLTNVVAWLEEPEPYKAEGSEEE